MEKIFEAMAEVKSTSWHKFLEIPCDTNESTESIMAAMRAYSDFFDDMDDEELANMLAGEWCSVCEDGVIVWADSDF